MISLSLFSQAHMTEFSFLQFQLGFMTFQDKSTHFKPSQCIKKVGKKQISERSHLATHKRSVFSYESRQEKTCLREFVTRLKPTSCSATGTSQSLESLDLASIGFVQANQMTSGPVNAHLTPGPGIYFNAFIHVYSPMAGADNPLGTNVDVNRKPLSLCPFVGSFKTISQKYDFKHILNYSYIYIATGQGQTTPWRHNFDVNRNSLSLCPFVANFKKKSL